MNKDEILKLLNEKLAAQMAATKAELAKGVIKESVTDYNPKSQGGTRKELLAKLAKTKDPKDAEAARKAGASQGELKAAMNEGFSEDELDKILTKFEHSMNNDGVKAVEDYISAEADGNKGKMASAAGKIKRFLKESETLEEGMPLKGHPYHDKSDDQLHFIIKDAGEAAEAMKGHDPKAEAKYLDQVNDASTVLHYRKNKKK